jgi:lipopolysaccharide export system protein LptC
MAAGGLEVNLPDLPEVSIRLGGDGSDPPPRPRRARLGDRVREQLTAYLPLLLMVALALGTWWLVKNAPSPAAPAAAPRAPGVPDYTLRGFSLQRYAPDGRLQLTLDGRQLRHFPENDRIEIEEVRMQADLAQGGRTQATARQAVANNKASTVQLMGGAVVRGKTREGQDVEIDSEYLVYRSDTGLLSTDRPVTVRVGDSRTQAAGLSWNLQTRALELKPPVRAVLQPRAPREPAGS